MGLKPSVLKMKGISNLTISGEFHEFLAPEESLQVRKTSFLFLKNTLLSRHLI